MFFLNNDTLVKPGWMDELVETFEQVPNIGIAGSKLLFADGKLQEAGGIIWRLGDGWNWGREPRSRRAGVFVSSRRRLGVRRGADDRAIAVRRTAWLR